MMVVIVIVHSTAGARMLTLSYKEFFFLVFYSSWIKSKIFGGISYLHFSCEINVVFSGTKTYC